MLSRKLRFWMAIYVLSQMAIISVYITFVTEHKPNTNREENGQNGLQMKIRINVKRSWPPSRDFTQDFAPRHFEKENLMKTPSNRPNLSGNTALQPILPVANFRASNPKFPVVNGFKKEYASNFPTSRRTSPTLNPPSKEYVHKTFTKPPQYSAISSLQHLETLKSTKVMEIGKRIARTKPRSFPKDFHISNDNTNHVQRNDKVKTILLYTPYFGRTPWPHPGFEAEMLFQENNGSRCAQACRITYSRDRLRESDAVIFHANDIWLVGDLKSLSQSRTQTQRWIYLSLENPMNSPSSPHFNGIFNWTSTYRTDSDVYMPYNNYQKILPHEIPKEHSNKNYAKGKNKLVAWAVAHCGVQFRDLIVRKLLKFINVTVFGHCSSRFQQNYRYGCPRGTKECSKTLRTFKFYLSFENALCKDYVTEKYWETPLEHEMVPIVFGSNYNDNNTIPGSYINVWDFQSIEALANYITYLDKNDTAYNAFFQWKIRYKVQNHSWRCMLCEKLYNEALQPKVYESFPAFWSRETNCNSGELVEKFHALLNG